MRQLSWSDADRILDHYRNYLSPNFPFVIVPTSHSCVTLLRTGKSAILLAILTVASYGDGELQLVCESVFRHFLARKFFIRAEQSLQLLQSLLVFLGWHQYCYRPGMQELYRNCQVLMENGMHDIVNEKGEQ